MLPKPPQSLTGDRQEIMPNEATNDADGAQKASQTAYDDPQTVAHDPSRGSVPLLGITPSRFEDGSRTRTTATENTGQNGSSSPNDAQAQPDRTRLAPLLGTISKCNAAISVRKPVSTETRRH